MTTPDQAETPTVSLFAKTRWPLIAVALLGGHVVLMMTAVVLGLTIPGATAPLDGFKDRVAWDDYQQQRTESENLGWALVAEVAPEATVTGDRVMRVQVADASGSPLAGGELLVRLYHYAHADEPIERQATLDATGEFSATLPLRQQGLWRVEAMAVRSGDRFLTEQDLWVHAAEARR